MSTRSSQNPIPIDYSQCIDSNFKDLSDRCFSVREILSRSTDWCLLDFIEEYLRRGCVEETILCSLISISGSLSQHSFTTNIFTGAKVWLNTAFHVLGSSGDAIVKQLIRFKNNRPSLGTNKSFVPEEMMYALHELDRSYPGYYSSNEPSDADQEEMPPKKTTTSKRVPWAMLVSTITEAALSQYMSYSDLTIINQDGDQALKHLNYYDQGNTGTAVFCWAVDGCQPGQSRTTGVERITNRLAEPSKLSIFVASTGSKFAPSFQKFHEEKVNDGVFSRVSVLSRSLSGLTVTSR